MKTLLLLVALTASCLAQNETWNLPLAQQDTTITYTVAQARVDSLVYVTDKGRHVVQAVFDAEMIAARLRLATLATQITPFVVAREVVQRRQEVALAIAALDAENMTNADYRTAARVIKARTREYSRTTKKGSVPSE